MDQEKTPQQSVPPGELEHLEQILRMVNEELEEAQRSVDKMDDEYKEAQQYIADSHGEGDPKEMFQTRMLMGQIDNRGASAVVYRDRLKKTKSSLGVVGVCGALCHNAAQLCVAYLLTTTSVLFYVPFLLLFGVLTGLLTGLVLKATLPPLERLKHTLG